MIVIAISGFSPTPFPTTTVAMFLDPKLVKWKSSGNVKILLNTICSIQGARFLSSDDSLEAPWSRIVLAFL